MIKLSDHGGERLLFRFSVLTLVKDTFVVVCFFLFCQIIYVMGITLLTLNVMDVLIRCDITIKTDKTVGLWWRTFTNYN